MNEGERIAKVIARSGLCSRRDAEKYIIAGRVKVDGKVITSPALNVTEKNLVEVDGKNLNIKDQTRLFIFHKPRSIVTTHKDENGRQTLFEILPKGLPRLISVGRLDLNTEGLILLTNDGELARKLELPSSNLTRTYRVRVWGEIDHANLDKVRKGVIIEGMKYKPAKITIDDKKDSGKNFWMEFTILEGKNREIRKFCDYIGLEVSRLIRVSFGPFELAELKRGEITEVPTNVWQKKLQGVL